MYKRWESFNITSLSYPCAPKYFLENYLDWNSSISPNKFSIVKDEQENTMEIQYYWYPKGALLTPSAFFLFGNIVDMLYKKLLYPGIILKSLF